MNRSVAYLGILFSVILGGILGLVASAIAFHVLDTDAGFIHMLIAIALGAFIGGALAVIRVRRYMRIEKQFAKYLTLVPKNAGFLIKAIIREMRYRKKVQGDVMAELVAHFEDELRDCKSDEERQKKTAQLIAEFGDAKLLAVLLRRAKKRCRPLWRTIAARTFQATGVLVLCFIIYVVWFFSGKPVATTDYIAELNQIVRPVADETLNAAAFYNKAAKLCDNLPKDISELLGKRYNEVTSERKQLIRKWLTDNEEIFELVIAGTQKPYYWQKYESGETGEVIAIIMPDLSGLRKLAYSLLWRIWFSAEQGQYQAAFDDIKACYRLGQHLRGDKTLIEQLVGMAIEARSIQTIRDIISEYQINSAALAKLQQDFEHITASEDFVISLKAEKMFLYDEIQRCFTKGHLGSGHLYLPRLMVLAETPAVEPEYIIPSIIYGAVLSPQNWSKAAKVLFTHPNKEQTKEMVDRLYASWDKMARKTPAQIRAEGIDIEKETMEIVKSNLLLEILVPAVGRVSEISYRLPVNVQATLTIIALLRYKQNLGHYPGNLNDLITAGYLNTLPMDSYSDKPLIYKKTDGNFILYSIGHNFKDDDGKVVRDSKGRVKRWADEGDWVFWPVPKSGSL